MRAFFVVLSMTATLSSYAQSISVADFRALLSIETPDSVSTYLSGKGYFSTNNVLDLSARPSRIAKAWKFTAGKKDDKAVSTILKYEDSSSYQVAFKTVSPFIFTQIINNLVASGFNRVEAVASEQSVELIFSNGNEQILTRSASLKTDPEYLLFYKRVPGKLMAYHQATTKHHRIYAEPGNRYTEDNEHPARKTISRKKTAVPATRKTTSRPAKRYYHRESYE